MSESAMQVFRERFAGRPWAFWIDNPDGWTYMGADPVEVVEYRTEPPRLAITRDGKTEHRAQTLFDYLDAMAGTSVESPAPFHGGYVGYFGYGMKADCGSPNLHHSTLPDAILIRAEQFVAIRNTSAGADVAGGSQSPQVDSLPQPEYLNRVGQCLEHIAAGETYEICLTNQARLSTTTQPLDYYEALRSMNPAPYSAFLDFGEVQVACSSPECFLRIDTARNVESSPIKGTLPRSADPAEDVRLRDRLATDERFQAENLMIVDLVRNDLSRVCTPGTVRVPRMMEVETYATVHQLVSTITGKLRDDAKLSDILGATFPGGSMTGAPKLRTMELIDRLEPCAREIYSGSIGWLGFDGAADLNIVIRSAVFHGDSVTIGSGGAIVSDSVPLEEWQEMRLKSKALMRAFDGV